MNGFFEQGNSEEVGERERVGGGSGGMNDING